MPRASIQPPISGAQSALLLPDRLYVRFAQMAVHGFAGHRARRHHRLGVELDCQHAGPDLQILPGAWHPDKLLGIHVPGFGVLLTLLILLVVGAVASNFAGRKLVQWGDALVHRIPGGALHLPSVKQVSDTCFPKAVTLSTAVLVQWPREGLDGGVRHRGPQRRNCRVPA